MAKENETRENETTEQPSAEKTKTDRSIPYPRFKEVVSERNNLRSDVAEREAKIEQLEKNLKNSTEKIDNLNEFKQELDDWKKQRYEKNVDYWDQKKKVFDVEEGDPNFEKVEKIKHRFKFGEELEPSEVAQNIEILKTYEEIDFFQNEKTPTEFNSKKASGKPAKEGDYGGYDSIEELARHDWKAAGEYLKEHRKE